MPTDTATSIQIDAQRQEYLEQLFYLDGRDDPAHPHHATYTGLFQQRQQQLLTADRQALLGLAATGDDTALHELLGPYISPGLLPDLDTASAITTVICRILSTRLRLAAQRLDPPEQPRTHATQAVVAIADWLQHEALRSERAILQRAA